MTPPNKAFVLPRSHVLLHPCIYLTITCNAQNFPFPPSSYMLSLSVLMCKLKPANIQCPNSSEENT